MSDFTCGGSPQGEPGQEFSSVAQQLSLPDGFRTGKKSLFREVHFQGKVCICASLALPVEQPVRS